MEFALLGPLLVTTSDDGGRSAAPTAEPIAVPIAVPISAAKQRTLLATLLLSANQVVSMTELTEAIWDGDAPASARITVQGLVRRLRQNLGDPDGVRIVTAPSGYLIRTAPGELDTSRFAALLADGQRAAGAEDWPAAGRLLHEALGLWRGQPLSDVPSALLARTALPRLAELRLQALDWRIKADLHLGRHDQLIAELRELITEHPLQERFHAHLMLALYRCGRQADALAAYRRLREILADELGTDPTPELRRLHQRILSADPSLSNQDIQAGASPVAPARSGAQTVPRQLPAAASHFVGRASELTVLSGLLDSASVGATVVVSAIGGTAGIGKTTLAVRWAHQVAPRFPGGQLYLNLRGYDPSGQPVAPAEALRGFLTAFGVPAGRIPVDLAEQTALYRSVLAEKKVLVLLDNARDSAQVRPLLPGSAGCVTVITSRDQLSGLVATEGARPLRLDLPSVAEARELLVRRLGAERVAAEPAAVQELIELGGRLPLALSVLAARAAAHPGFTLRTLVTDLRQVGGLDALDGGDPSSSVRGVFSWSYRQLTRPAARLFRLLGLHPGQDISRAAVAALAGLDSGATHRALAELTAGHLVVERAPGRYTMHDLLRAYAIERAEADETEDSRADALRRLLGWYLHNADAADRVMDPAGGHTDPDPAYRPAELLTFADRDASLAWLEAERANMVAAVRVAVEHGLDVIAWQLPSVLLGFFYLRSYWTDWSETHLVSLSAAERLGDLAAQASTLNRLGILYSDVDRLDEAIDYHRRALAIQRELGDELGGAWTLNNLGVAYCNLGWHPDAAACFHAALVLFRVTRDQRGEGLALNNVGDTYRELGRMPDAERYLRAALALQSTTDDHTGERYTHYAFGDFHRDQGEHAEALTHYQRALEISQTLGDRWGSARALTHLGDTHEVLGADAAAREAWQRALTILTELHHPNADALRAKLHAGDVG